MKGWKIGVYSSLIAWLCYQFVTGIVKAILTELRLEIIWQHQILQSFPCLLIVQAQWWSLRFPFSRFALPSLRLMFLPKAKPMLHAQRFSALLLG